MKAILPKPSSKFATMPAKIFAIITILLISSSCQVKKEAKEVERGFYFWRSRFSLAPAERQALLQLKTQQLYVKFFDVAWDDNKQQPQPVAKIKFAEAWPASLELIPVVFITNETLQQSTPDDIVRMALQMANLMRSICEKNQLPEPQEIQIDCDWTSTTKDRYFLLLTQLRKTAFMAQKKMSATIRLHQVKYRLQSGIPPVDKGLLMCYNMGNLQQPQTTNSIIDATILQQYIGNARSYPLALDIALPIFNWWVWFSGEQYRGLLPANTMQMPLNNKQQWLCQTDTIINGYTFKAGDWLRFENSPAEMVRKVISLLRPQLNSSDIHIILYHLDEKMLANYETAALENFYSDFSH